LSPGGDPHEAINQRGKKMSGRHAFGLAVAFLVSVPTATLADSANWDAEKAAQVDRDRNTNSGLGNGGEALVGGAWVPLASEETSGFRRRDQDPGNAGSQCQGGKNPPSC
jgi:hypothetical protein